MYCKHCGNQLPDNALFCPACGKSVNDGAAFNFDTNASEPIRVQVVQPEEERKNIFGVLSIIFGSLSCTIALAILFLIPSIITCILAVLTREKLGKRMVKPGIVLTAIPAGIFAFIITVGIIATVAAA